MFKGDLDYDGDNALNIEDDCPRIPLPNCANTNGDYSIIDQVLFSDVTGDYTSQPTYLTTRNDYTDVISTTYNCASFSISLISPYNGGCNSPIADSKYRASSNGEFYGYFTGTAGSNPGTIHTHWGELELSDNWVLHDSLKISDDGRFVIYYTDYGIKVWEKGSDPQIILPITSNNGEQGTSKDPETNSNFHPRQ